MNPRVVNVKPESNYMLLLKFTNGEIRRFDMKPYLNCEVFRPLQNQAFFKSVRPFIGSIQWPNEADLCPDTLYLDSKAVKESF
jgi:hypothetical protein